MQSSPTIAAVFLQPQCDMRCSFCVAEETFDRMTFSQAAALIECLAEQGYQSVVLGGGEPMLWPHGVLDLAQHIQNQGMIAQVNTNGLRLAPGFENESRTNRWILPIESYEAQFHNAMRHTPAGHFELIESRLRTLQSSTKSEVTLSTVVCKENLPHLAKLTQLVLAYVQGGLPLHAWHLYQFIPQGRSGLQSAQRHQVQRADYLKVAKAAQLECAQQGVTVYLRPNMHLSKTVSFHWMNDGAYFRQYQESISQYPGSITSNACFAGAVD